MTIDRLTRFFDAWNDHDVGTIVEYFTSDGAYLASIGPDDGGTAFHGTEEIRRGVAAFLGMYQNAHYADLVIGMDEERAFASWTFSGSNAGGEDVTYRGVDLFEFDGDLIKLKDAYRKERSRPIGA
jgi:hypothetical protein